MADPGPDEIARWRQTYHALAETQRQIQAQKAIRSLDLLNALAPFDPLLIGTIPLGIDTPTSDLDVACFAPDLSRFVKETEQLFGAESRYRHKLIAKRQEASAVVNFWWKDLEIELFAQALPLGQQYGVRHALVEGRLLAMAGNALAQAVRTAKLKGIPTEPAFADLLGLMDNKTTRFFTGILTEIFTEIFIEKMEDAYHALWLLSFQKDPVLAVLLSMGGWLPVAEPVQSRAE